MASTSTSNVASAALVDPARVLAESTQRAVRSVSALGGAIYAANVQVSPQLARAVQAQQNLYDEIDGEFGLLTSAEAGQRMGSRSAALRNAATAARRSGKLLALRRGGYWLFPAFQFDEAGLRPEIAELIALATEHQRTEAGLIQWLCSPTTYLGGSRPVDVLDDSAQVLDAARRAFGVQW
ncbi:MAG: hypothetical protein ACR2P2_05215 [Nakamurella sp.]